MKGGIYKTRYGWQVRFGKITRRFKQWEHTEEPHKEFTPAERFLNGLRYETDKGTYDIRDYQTSQPLAFGNLIKQFLETKRKKSQAQKKYSLLLSYAQNLFHKNIKTVGFKEIEELVIALEDRGLASKTIYDFICTLKMFYVWVIKCEGKRNQIEMPDFPEVTPIMAYRKILTKEQQQAVLNEIHRLTWDLNPRIYIAVLFMATYINCRPNEILNIKEKDLELENGRILIRKPKEIQPKYIYLLHEDISTIRTLETSFPGLYFFRHTKGNGGALPHSKFGRDYLPNQWRKACKGIGIKGVSLYPGTRHTTAVYLRQRHSPESVKRAMGTRSNKAFDRYLQVTGDELRSLYADTRTDNVLITLLGNSETKISNEIK